MSFICVLRTFLIIQFDVQTRQELNIAVDFVKFLAINFFLPSSLFPNTNDSYVVKCYCFVGYRQTKKQDRNKQDCTPHHHHVRKIKGEMEHSRNDICVQHTFAPLIYKFYIDPLKHVNSVLGILIVQYQFNVFEAVDELDKLIFAQCVKRITGFSNQCYIKNPIIIS